MISMQVIIVGVALAFTGLLLLLRNLLFRRPAGRSHVVHMLNPVDGGNDRPDPGSLEEWPSIIGGEERSVPDSDKLSEEDRIQLAVMQERILRMIR